MLPKNSRIKRIEFFDIIKNGKRYNTPHLLLYLSKIDPKSKFKNSKFSVSVSKKISKSAVRRNKIRRQAYNIISKYTESINNGFLFFFSLKKDPMGMSFKILDSEIAGLLSSLGVLK